jgi:hypothetical protein
LFPSLSRESVLSLKEEEEEEEEEEEDEATRMLKIVFIDIFG